MCVEPTRKYKSGLIWRRPSSYRLSNQTPVRTDPFFSPHQVPNYYKIIKQPMDLKKVKRKLQVQSSQYYTSTQEFVSDMRLVFKNCAKYNEVRSMSLEPALGFGEWPLLVRLCITRG